MDLMIMLMVLIIEILCMVETELFLLLIVAKVSFCHLSTDCHNVLTILPGFPCLKICTLGCEECTQTQ